MSDHQPELSISVVSHGQAKLIEKLLRDIESLCVSESFEVILTLNILESLQIDPQRYSFPLILIQNEHPKGFGQNHNAAFLLAKGRYFCVLNPDIRLQHDPFPSLLSEFANFSVGVAAPRIENGHGYPEDSARNFPTLMELFGKLFGRPSAIHGKQGNSANDPDWMAGMFLVFPREVFAKIGGFDERYFLYYEDVDICLRLRLEGYVARLCGSASAIHEAQRASHHNFKYMYWHLSSMIRFFLSAPYRRMRRRKRR